MLSKQFPDIEFWWRDDDAISQSHQLDLLIALEIPIKLAVIPDKVEAAFELPTHFKVWQHGFSHTNHGTHKKCEISDEVDQATLIENLKNGQQKLRDFFPNHFENTFVPPWNRMDPKIEMQLTFYDHISSIYTHIPQNNISRKDIHVDLVDWHTKTIKPIHEIYAEIETLIEEGFNTIGILSHHLIHSNRDFKLLNQLINK